MLNGSILADKNTLLFTDSNVGSNGRNIRLLFAAGRASVGALADLEEAPCRCLRSWLQPEPNENVYAPGMVAVEGLEY